MVRELGHLRTASCFGLGLRFAGCELRMAFKGMDFLILVLTDINYYHMIIEGLITKGLIIIIKGCGEDKYNNN